MSTLSTILFLCVIATIIGLSVSYSISNTILLPTPLIGIQQGPPLIPSDATANANVGFSVGLNFNGSIMVTGGFNDNNGIGAAWVYVRSNTTWNQQTSKLIGSGASGGVVNQGKSVAISSVEGKTMLSGGIQDNNDIGATWVFVQTNQTWIQQGSKLVGLGYSGISLQGSSVALSSDGNTALIGGLGDNSTLGASWIFVRSNQTWIQQGNKLVGNGYSGSVVDQGNSVSLSGDGNTALIGGNGDNGNNGASWVFVRTNQTWSQQGSKLVGSGASGNAQQGNSVSISRDGNTAMIGGYLDAGNVGAVWVFTRTNNAWSQQGNKLIATGGTINDTFGSAVSLNQNGNIAVIGADGANSGRGQFYIFVRTNQTIWNQVGSAKVASGLTGTTPEFGNSIALSSDGSTSAVGAVVNGPTQTGAVVVFV